MGKVIPVIMCGGSGTRVWPESRESLPKQFIPLIGETSTFQSVVKLLSDRAIFEEPIVITNLDYRFRVAEQLEEIGAKATIVLEPVRRDSGPAVATAAVLAARSSPDAVLAVLAADHVFSDGGRFAELCREAGEAAAGGLIVTFGVKPDHPATGYGYIRAGDPIDAAGKLRKVAAFVEKPDAATAERFVAEGYLWNSGNFVFRADIMLGELTRFEPDMASAVDKAVAAARRDLEFLVLDSASFAGAPKKSIDYAVMERTDKAAVMAADVGWSDVGLWSTVWRLSERDSNGNSLRGQVFAVDSHNVLVRSSDPLVAVIGLDNVVVVATEDAVLVADQRRSDEVKQLVETLKAKNRREATEHKRDYRPWGYYQTVDEGARYKVKRIVVKPGGRLSLQKHHHRSEHWVVVRGAAEVARNGEVLVVHENESIYLPMGCEHRMANPGKINLELIEVQTGSYLGEDDIIRIEDVYNRA
ncbi:MAG TPA: mannose-1-phosphate guanylyltransferase/mannose-6-phosphate isomerase [Roseiarcus sp.]|jgi:mannose-1-phosphate guanylyltransferase/mannose-6-phosphate isomerase|nr:mannose-1-phosphate guanylyltransferase/mannose-6-phosphate isomerase [Roseiarcus sp.]